MSARLSTPVRARQEVVLELRRKLLMIELAQARAAVWEGEALALAAALLGRRFTRIEDVREVFDAPA